MSGDPIRPRARTTRAGRALALRVLYAAELAHLTPSEVWRRVDDDLLFEDEDVPAPRLTLSIDASRDGAPVSEATSDEDDDAEAPAALLPEGWQAALEAAQAQPRRAPRADPGAAAAARALTLIQSFEARADEVDEALQRSSPRWKIKRMAPLDRNLLRLGVLELLEGILPPRDVIYDCVELGKRYGDGNTPRFVNGILDQLCRDNQISL
jgi:N utilization substance protein B